MKLTPERIRAALAECHGSRKDAAKVLGLSADLLRKNIRCYRDKGHTFPKPQNELARQDKCAASLQPGQWVETGQGQQCGSILAIECGKAFVMFLDGESTWLPVRQLAWVPSGDVIAEGTRLIRDAWPPGEHAKRARWAIRGAYEIPQVTVEDDSRDVVW
jgi:hypothetical protein